MTSADIATASHNVAEEGGEIGETSLTSDDNGLRIDDSDDESGSNSHVISPEGEEHMALISEEPESTDLSHDDAMGCRDDGGTGQHDSGNDDAIRRHDDDDSSVLDEGPYVRTKSSKRKESFVLSIIPGRRDSVSLQFVKLPRFVLSRRQHQSNRQLEEREIDSSDEVELFEEDGKREERRDRKPCIVQLKQSVIKSLKTLKEYFV